MKLREVVVTNFRGYETETRIPFDLLTVLIGRNDSGKSSILEALDIYFNEYPIERDDCCVHSGSTEIKIGCVFDDLPDTLVIDDQYETSLSDEYLVRTDGKLELVKVYDCNAAKGKCTGAYAVARHPSATGVDDLLSLKITELRTKAQQRNVDLTNVNQTAKSPIRKAIWNATNDLQFLEKEVALKKESAKAAFEQLQHYFPSYALFKSDRPSTDQDSEAQDPLKAAIKEAIRRRETELDGVIAEIRTELERVASRTVEKIREMSPSLANQLQPTVKNKNWDGLFSVSLTGDNAIPINKRGSGTRRLVLLNFFRAKAEDSAIEKDTGVIYAVEEPETSQHPNHQVMLLEAFHELVSQGNCQVILTTHTPTLARRVDQSCLRLVAIENGHPAISSGTEVGTLEKIVSTLGVLRDHNVKVFLGVEGKHDINFLRHLSAMLSRIETDIPDLAAAEASGCLVFVPLGGSSLELWVSRLQGLNLPEFYITDRDNAPPALPKYQRYLAEWNARQGCTAWVTSKRELENYLHLSLLTAAAPGYTGTGMDFDDVPALFAEAIHTAAPGTQPWANIAPEKKEKKISSAKKRLNNEIATQMTPALLTQVDTGDDLRRWLRTVGQALTN